MTDGRFRDRVDAGRRLGERLQGLQGLRGELQVLGLPRGGVPVAAEVAEMLDAPLDIYVVRKLGVPGHEELAMGAIASGGTMVLDGDLIRRLDLSRHDVEAVAERELAELQRREDAYRSDRLPLVVAGRTVLLVDDGLATGATMRAAIAALRGQQPARIIAAAPVGAPATCARVEEEADEVVCLHAPTPFLAVGHHYEDFSPTTDDEVRAALRSSPTASTSDARRATTSATRTPITEREAYDTLLDLVGDRRLVLLGEASHGSHEFYAERARITRRLIDECGFSAVAVEADWPDAYRVNRYIRGADDDRTAEAALGDFVRFPRWMWRNVVVRDFIEWLRHRNSRRRTDDRVGFYGLDLYSLQSSIMAVVGYLDRVDPAAAGRARKRYACFDHAGSEGQIYGAAVAYGRADPCEDEAVEQLVELRRKAAEVAAGDGRIAEDEAFYAAQNARLVANAERYYRAMYTGRATSWNLRDRHMADTLDALSRHLGSGDQSAKIVVWAHNSHLGDARATEMSARGELNLGQLVRERHGDAALLVGFTTAGGTVTAASEWDSPPERKRILDPLPDSVEDLLHGTGDSAFLMTLSGAPEVADPFSLPRLQRAIGVIYRPETERMSHYFWSRVTEQFDALIHIDQTTALEPLDLEPGWKAGMEPPETYPSGI